MKKYKYNIMQTFVLLTSLIFILTCCVYDVREEIVISIPYNEYVRNIETNYYKLWLEKQTGLSITFNIIYEIATAEYLRSMFSSGYVTSDAFISMFNGENAAQWNSLIYEFGKKGYIIPLNEYIDNSIYLNSIFENFVDYDLRAAMASADGNIYYMPGFDPSIPERHFQVFWLNQNWLKSLNLNVPQTTGELHEVLTAFKANDPNGNGIQDEIPLAGSYDVPSEQIQNIIINSFIYNDPGNSRIFFDNGAIRFAPATDEWREAMKYLNGLYADGLITPFTYSHQTLTSLANSPWDVLGGFASHSITDVLFQSNPDIINAFLHIAPLSGPEGVRSATVSVPFPKPAGVITSACKNPEAVFNLFDLMLSEDAFLIGRYGEENVDWVRANITDTDFYGNKASIRVINHMRNRTQNKHLNETAPFFAYPHYADGVTFSTFEFNFEYKNARAYWLYERFKPRAYLNPMFYHYKQNNHTIRYIIDKYTDESIEAFITGGTNPFDDLAWEAHLQKYNELGIDNLLKLAEDVMK